MSKPRYAVMWNHTRNWYDVYDVASWRVIKHFDTAVEAEKYTRGLR